MNTELDLKTAMKQMTTIARNERAGFACGADGRGFLVVNYEAVSETSHPFNNEEGPDNGALKTDALVLVFEDVQVVTGGTFPPHVLVNRLDLCPNMRKVRLADYFRNGIFTGKAR